MTAFGVLAVFSDPETLTEAARQMRQRGYSRMDAFSPFPVHGLARTLGKRKTRLQWLVLAGGIAGAAASYGLILYSVLIDYPINVGGRGLHAWPAFAVLAFEGGILGAALAAFLGMLAANRLPEYHHPAFNAPSFTYARGGKFYLLIETADPAFRKGVTKRHLKRLGAEKIEEVEP